MLETIVRKKMHGVFRGLGYSVTCITWEDYDKVMDSFNELSLPMIRFHKNYECWFTEAGKKKFEPHIMQYLELFFKYDPKYIKEWNMIESEVELDDYQVVKYQDEYQVVLNTAA